VRGSGRNSPGLLGSRVVVDDDHNEAIKRARTKYNAATIPGAGLLILPSTSHFAFLQVPKLFSAALLNFVGDH
jgi:pimeloyl-ACP methyl ester carboxylesterase